MAVRFVGILLGLAFAIGCASTQTSSPSTAPATAPGGQAGTGVLNFVFSEERPQRGGRLRYFHSGGSSASIHMTNTMAVARVFDYEIAASGWTGTGATLARVGVYAIPAVTAWQRMRSDQHYLWNVVLGGGASLYITSALLRAHERQAKGASGPRIAVSPLVTQHARGLRFACSF